MKVNLVVTLLCIFFREMIVRPRVVGILIIVPLILIFWNLFSIPTTDVDYLAFSSTSEDAYLVYTTACKIPKVDPFAPSVAHLLPPDQELMCNADQDIVYQQDNKLIINRKAVNSSVRLKKLSDCTYESIWRPIDKPTSHNYFRYNNASKPFESSTTLDSKDEFVRVKCFDNRKKYIYTNFFTSVQKKDFVEKRCKKLQQKYSKHRDEQLSVMMLGVESISQINMVRYMKKTRKYLFQNMSVVELLGYNKIADNTFPNIVPMTTGKHLEELPWNETVKDIPLDRYDFMWNKFSREGYRTFYAEDAPKIAIFDYHKAGFERPAADYYNRHLSQAMEQDEKTAIFWNNDHNCIHGRPETSFTLKYLKQFMTVFKDDPYFAFTFISRLTHDRLERAAMADRLYEEFLQSINQNSILNKTVIFFFSDHGLRFGRVRETFIGKLEERLPFMFLIFPDWFLRKYPKIKDNLNRNAKKLTTPFDIYATLLDILHFKGERKPQVKIKRSISLMDDIPESRSCDDVDMLPHWCSCADHKILPVGDETVVASAEQMIKQLNEQLERFPDCELLKIGEIKFASKLILPTKVLTFKSSDWDVINRTVVFGNRIDAYVDYQLMLSTEPGGALFEGTVRYNEEQREYTLMGEVSRINLYGTQSHCVDNSQLKKICYCKVQQL